MGMKIRTSIMLAIVLVVTLMLALPVLAGGPHNKATGTVVWTARTHLPPAEQIPGIISSFDVHDAAPGMYSDRGTHSIYRPPDTNYGFSGGSLSLDVACVYVDGYEAWFAGTVTVADGGYSGLVGDVFLYWVEDFDTPGSAGPDLIGGRGYGTIEEACNVVNAGGWTGTGIVTDGNLKVHYWDS
jgi:hypothetical protein